MASIYCERCGRLDSSLRVTVFTTVVSIVIASHKNPRVAILCETCRKTERWRPTILSALFGWWGIPWGLFWTLEALAENLGGGKQPAENNAALLAVVGQSLVERGDSRGALEAWNQSLAYKNDPVVERAIIELRAQGSVRAATPAVRFRPGDRVVARTGVASMYAEPAGQSATRGVLSGDSAAIVLTAHGDWLEVRFLGGGVGWLRPDEVRTSGESE